MVLYHFNRYLLGMVSTYLCTYHHTEEFIIALANYVVSWSVTDNIRTRHFSLNAGLFRLQLHGAIYRPDSFVMMLRYCANLKAIRYESTSLNRIAADKSHRVIVA